MCIRDRHGDPSEEGPPGTDTVNRGATRRNAASALRLARTPRSLVRVAIQGSTESIPEATTAHTSIRRGICPSKPRVDYSGETFSFHNRVRGEYTWAHGNPYTVACSARACTLYSPGTTTGPTRGACKSHRHLSSRCNGGYPPPKAGGRRLNTSIHVCEGLNREIKVEHQRRARGCHGMSGWSAL